MKAQSVSFVIYLLENLNVFRGIYIFSLNDIVYSTKIDLISNFNTVLLSNLVMYLSFKAKSVQFCVEFNLFF